MSELKAKDPRAPHVAGGAPSRTGLAGPPPAGLALPLDGLLFPRPEPPSAEPPGCRAPEKDGGLLDSVLDSLLAPAGRAHSHPGPASGEPEGAWSLFGPELPAEPRTAPAGCAPRPEPMSRPEGKALPRGLSPSRPPLPPGPGSPPWVRTAPKPPPPPAVVELEEEEDDEQEEDTEEEEEEVAGEPRDPAGPPPLKGKARPPADPGPKDDARFPAARAAPAEAERAPLAGAVVDVIHLPIVPLGQAFLAARTRQLLEDDGMDGAAPGPPRASPPAPAAPAADFPDCAFAPDEPKDNVFPLYGDFPPLKIKEEEEGGRAAGRSPRPYLLAAAPPAVFADFPLPPRATPARAGELLAAGPAGAAGLAGLAGLAGAAAPGPGLEGLLYKAEAAPPPGPCAPPPARTPGAACLLPAAPAAPVAPAAPPGSGPALYPPLGLNALPPLGYQAAVLKDALPQVYPPFLGYLRPDSEASQSPQYSFESLPQKICLICGDEASGCHYGVLTCGSCKVFFKRAMEGRKFKKFSKVRVMRALDGVTLPQPVGISNESQALSQRLTFSPSQDILLPPLISLLMSIEPDMVYSGHDNSKPDTASSLLTSLNHLGERQLLSVVKWSKLLPGFRNLHIDDQITLIQYSWMSLMVFGLGWRSYKHVSGQMLYFAPDLILDEQRMKESSFYSLCLTMWQIPQEFVKLQVSQEEFLCMKVLLLLNTIPLEGLRSQSQFEDMRTSYIRELIKAIGLRQKGVVSSSQRFYQLTKFLDSLHDLVKQLHLYCLNTFIQSRSLSVEFPEMMSEVIAAQLPKILAGMVKPLLFHKK
ncbi:progesterone receptor isoform X2 [Erinaceus europaeus]|uniref:Progesterone receptor n=1 Tax=Erinaceus europaeus TaxID=9365 RepID=A0ABM3WGK8_ERIEU|nr:progesterone receptor isoform X2 [Erinaceus europaeus]